ncbi:MAG TPA: PKD domain-containing protein [Thermoplasmata archaeon]|nr:PKD domain-containing protein [Thermoplasmata archaeon]
MEEDIPLPPEEDDELPPPPSDIAEETKHFPPIKTKKSGPLATIRRALVIFEKDIRTMAKHGLISSIILFVFLIVVFSIMSFSMKQAMSFDIGGMMGGDEIDVPWATENNPPVADAGNDRSIPAGTTIMLDASGSYDDDRIVYYFWSFYDGIRQIELYGEQVPYTFYMIGEYEIRLTVVDYSINQAEDTIWITVNQAGSDTEWPQAVAPMSTTVLVGDTMTLYGGDSTDNVGIVNWTWTFYDGIDRVLFGEEVDYTFQNAGYGEIWITLTVTDAAGNYQSNGFGVYVEPEQEQEGWLWAEIEDVGLVVLGDEVTLDGSKSESESSMIESWTWYVKHNNTISVLSGETVVFTPQEWGIYDVTLIVRDVYGYYASSNQDDRRTQFLVAPAGTDADAISWSSTPFGIDVSFNLLTYAYGVALLSSVMFIGGLFAKGYSHEIQKGTIKVLFFGPISVTTVIFSKILYPIVIGPFLIFPLVMFSLSTFGQDPGEIFMITMVAYLLAVTTMVAAAYGSCLIYLLAKRMVLKPSVISRMFLYFSLLGTLTVFEWMSFVMDMWLKVETYGNMYDDYGGGLALLSPFHQGGVYISSVIMGTSQSPEWGVFIIPIALIALGVMASKKLYPDLFSRE